MTLIQDFRGGVSASVHVEATDPPQFGAPEVLAEIQPAPADVLSRHAPAADGQRSLVMVDEGPPRCRRSTST